MMVAHVKDGKVKWIGSLPKGCRTVHLEHSTDGKHWDRRTQAKIPRAVAVGAIDLSRVNKWYRLSPAGEATPQPSAASQPKAQRRRRK